MNSHHHPRVTGYMSDIYFNVKKKLPLLNNLSKWIDRMGEEKNTLPATGGSEFFIL
jgi:hypothetical protein